MPTMLAARNGIAFSTAYADYLYNAGARRLYAELP